MAGHRKRPPASTNHIPKKNWNCWTPETHYITLYPPIWDKSMDNSHLKCWAELKFPSYLQSETIHAMGMSMATQWLASGCFDQNLSVGGSSSPVYPLWGDYKLLFFPGCISYISYISYIYIIYIYISYIYIYHIYMYIYIYHIYIYIYIIYIMDQWCLRPMPHKGAPLGGHLGPLVLDRIEPPKTKPVI